MWGEFMIATLKLILKILLITYYVSILQIAKDLVCTALKIVDRCVFYPRSGFGVHDSQNRRSMRTLSKMGIRCVLYSRPGFSVHGSQNRRSMRILFTIRNRCVLDYYLFLVFYSRSEIDVFTLTTYTICDHSLVESEGKHNQISARIFGTSDTVQFFVVWGVWWNNIWSVETHANRDKHLGWVGEATKSCEFYPIDTLELSDRYFDVMWTEKIDCEWSVSKLCR
jgi:hypothetical protein